MIMRYFIRIVAIFLKIFHVVCIFFTNHTPLTPTFILFGFFNTASIIISFILVLLIYTLQVADIKVLRLNNFLSFCFINLRLRALWYLLSNQFLCSPLKFLPRDFSKMYTILITQKITCPIPFADWLCHFE